MVEVWTGSQVELRALGISNGQARIGAGILTDGQLDLTEVELTSNTATDLGGAVANDPGAGLTLTWCRLAGNVAHTGGGITNAGTARNPGVITLDACCLTGNTTRQEGGAIRNTGQLTLRNGTVLGALRRPRLTRQGAGPAFTYSIPSVP